ncbi:MAG: NAD-dependent epimerase/dehydratase family protein [Acidimicrobiales bacterium]|nr:NAD-dependent epimerase/dehydratase family protein [Acidimicrobiales bacterium]
MSSSNEVTAVAVTGASSPLGHKVVAAIVRDPRVERVVVLDRPGSELAGLVSAVVLERPVTVEPHAVDLADPGLGRALEGVTAIVHLGVSRLSGPDICGTGCAPDVPGTASLLDLAVTLGVDSTVVLSSALVYGAWPNNPIPLTEEAVLRPPAEVPEAVAFAEIERLVSEWRSAHPEAAVAILRPTVTVDPERRRWFSRSVWSGRGISIEGAEAPAQYLHIDDLVSAVVLARSARLEGPFNVAPDGWLAAEQVRELSGPVRRLPVPAELVSGLARLRSLLPGAAVPSGLLSYTVHPWVIANDRLRAAGWRPTLTNAEVFVDGDNQYPLFALNARRRQMLSFAALGAATGLMVGGVVRYLGRRGAVRHRASASR